MRSVMKHDFSRIPDIHLPRSVFDRSHGVKATFNTDYLVPILVDEVLPGDTFKLDMSFVARLATPKFPIMDNMFMDSFFFAVPNRLLWENWEKFQGAVDDPLTNPPGSIDYLLPTVDVNATEGSLSDYFGMPLNLTATVQSLPYRAYNLIYNAWFKDENLQDNVVVDQDDGPDNLGDYVLLKRGKRHDYFTSCLPWPQKGDSVTLPIATNATVWGTGNALAFSDDVSPYGYRAYAASGASTRTGSFDQLSGAGPYPKGSAAGGPEVGGSGSYYGIIEKGEFTDLDSGLYADLESSETITINQLREAFAMQRLFELDARGGTRYVEIIKAHFNVVSPDFRLQRPEYLGGGSSRIKINQVAQTSESNSGSPDSQNQKGSLAAFGTVMGSSHGFTKSFTEHCTIIGLINVRADLTYQQGIDRMWFRSTRFDFYMPELAHLGEQAVLKRELYYTNSATDEDVFGYQERWAEYRHKLSRICGLFRSDAALSLDAWHLSQDFGSLPDLDATFIQVDVPTTRIKAITSEADFIGDFYLNYICARPMPMYSVPGGRL